MDQHQRKVTRNHSDGHTGSPGSRQNERYSLFWVGRPRGNTQSRKEAGLLGIYNFPGAVYATDGSNDKGVMGAGYYRLDENRGG